VRRARTVDLPAPTGPVSRRHRLFFCGIRVCPEPDTSRLISGQARNFAARVGIIFGNPFDVVSKSIEAVCGEGRMLRVRLAAVEANRRIDIAFKQRFLIKTNHGLLVFFQFLISGRYVPSLICADA
jgi:hypothetical protein